MSLWRLEWLRLVRTRRLVVLVAIYAFFGVLGPFSARYAGEILKRFGGGVVVSLPRPKAADGIAQFAGNAQQLGLLAVVLIAAGALAFDAQRESAIFLRTRVRPLSRIVLARYGASALAAIAGFTLGAGLAWYESVALIGGLPAAGVVAGALYGGGFLAFVVALVALLAGVARGVVATAISALAIVAVLAVIGSLAPALGDWLPTALAGALAATARGASAAHYLPALATALASSVASLLGACALLARRDV